MPDHDRHSEPPEQLLVGADRPRPLPPYLRARLQELLSAAAVGDDEVSRPLSGQARDKLQNSLKPAQAGRPRKWVRLGSSFGRRRGHRLGAGRRHPRARPRAPDRPDGFFHGKRSRSARRGYTPSARALGAGRRPCTDQGCWWCQSRCVPLRAPASQHRRHPGRARPARPGPASTVPLVGAVSPHTGPASGGNWVVVRGAGLGSVTAVYFGNVAATMLTVVSPAELRALAPAHAVGTVDVVASGPPGRSKVSVADHYSFVG